ncbi:hypothetical protein [Los Azufres archaeal virus 1]|nr:hypothetical protein [Los Azufres archaeal virus 1]
MPSAAIATPMPADTPVAIFEAFVTETYTIEMAMAMAIIRTAISTMPKIAGRMPCACGTSTVIVNVFPEIDLLTIVTPLIVCPFGRALFKVESTELDSGPAAVIVMVLRPGCGVPLKGIVFVMVTSVLVKHDAGLLRHCKASVTL